MIHLVVVMTCLNRQCDDRRMKVATSRSRRDASRCRHRRTEAARDNLIDHVVWWTNGWCSYIITCHSGPTWAMSESDLRTYIILRTGRIKLSAPSFSDLFCHCDWLTLRGVHTSSSERVYCIRRGNGPTSLDIINNTTVSATANLDKSKKVKCFCF